MRHDSPVAQAFWRMLLDPQHPQATEIRSALMASSFTLVPVIVSAQEAEGRGWIVIRDPALQALARKALPLINADLRCEDGVDAALALAPAQ